VARGRENNPTQPITEEWMEWLLAQRKQLERLSLLYRPGPEGNGPHKERQRDPSSSSSLTHAPSHKEGSSIHGRPMNVDVSRRQPFDEIVLVYCRCVSHSLRDDVGDRWDSIVLHGTCTRPVQSEGSHHLLGTTCSTIQR
jgi:hypothetical protein